MSAPCLSCRAAITYIMIVRAHHHHAGRDCSCTPLSCVCVLFAGHERACRARSCAMWPFRMSSALVSVTTEQRKRNQRAARAGSAQLTSGTPRMLRTLAQSLSGKLVLAGSKFVRSKKARHLLYDNQLSWARISRTVHFVRGLASLPYFRLSSKDGHDLGHTDSA